MRHESRELRLRACERIFDRVSRFFPEEGVRLAEQIDDPSLKDLALQIAIHYMASADPLFSFEAASKIATEPHKSEALRKVFWQMALFHPDRIEEKLSQIESPSAQAAALKGYAERISLTRPNDATAIASRIEDPSLRRDALIPVVENWAKIDREQALQWLSDHASHFGDGAEQLARRL